MRGILIPGDTTRYATVGTGGPGIDPPIDPPDPPSGSLAFSFLDSVSDIVVIDGVLTERFRPDTADGRVWDARTSEMITDDTEYGAIEMDGEHENMAWAGGYVHSTKPWDATWRDHKDPNGCAVGNRATNSMISGVHAFNVHDGFRSNGASGTWTVQHCWLEYGRDDAIENDKLRGGLVLDCLFDGVYVGFSSRPSSSDSSSDANGEVMTIDRTLVRLEAHPWPYKWDDKGAMDEFGNEYDEDNGGIAYGHGNFFKFDKDEVPGRNTKYRIIDSVFCASFRVDERLLSFPPDVLIEECRGNVVVWLGPGEYPGVLPASGVEIVSGAAGRELWRQRVADWHARHPDVGANRKPANPGVIVFPKVF